MHAPAVRSVAAVLLALLLLARLAGAAPAGQEILDAPQIYDAVLAALGPETNRDVPRVARATIDETGDVTVVFALRDEGSLDAIRATALADTLAALWAVYHAPESDRVTTTTVLGTFAVIGKRGSARETPVLRAVLSADRAATLDWDALAPEQVPAIVDVWWLHAAFTDLAALRGEEGGP